LIVQMTSFFILCHCQKSMLIMNYFLGFVNQKMVSHFFIRIFSNINHNYLKQYIMLSFQKCPTFCPTFKNLVYHSNQRCFD
jgi:hypothetical protein